MSHKHANYNNDEITHRVKSMEHGNFLGE